MEIILLLILISLFNYFEQNTIIRIPITKGKFDDLPLFNILKNKDCYRLITWRWNLPYTGYYILNNIVQYRIDKNGMYDNDIINVEKNNSDLLSILYENNYLYNAELCEILYKIKYINKKMYSFVYYENQIYKYFGGLPNNLTNNLIKYKFNNKNEYVTKIEVKFDNGEIIKLGLENNQKFSFDDAYANMITLPQYIFIQLKLQLFSDYKKVRVNGNLSNHYIPYYQTAKYELKIEQIKAFPNISIQIGNKIINLNKNIIFNNLKNNSLFIHRDKYGKIIYFGQRFLELFNITEYDLETRDCNLYLDKNNNYFIEEIENIKDIKKSDFKVFIIIFFIVIFAVAVTIFKNYHKNKKIKYYNYYYEI